MKKLVNKSIAAFLACVVAVAGLPGAVRGSSGALSGDTEEYFVPTAADFADVSGWWTEKIPYIQELGEGGARLVYNGGDVGRCIPTAGKYNIDGLTLYFDNLTKNDGCTDALRFSLLFSTAQGGLGDFRIQIDTDAGALSYFSGTVAPVVFLTNELLRYESLSESPFAVRFDSEAGGSLKCTVAVGAQVFSGSIPFDALSAAVANNTFKFNAESNYVKIAPGRNYGDDDYFFSVDVAAIGYDAYTRPTSSTLYVINQSGLSSLASTPNGPFPFAVRCAFNGCDVGNRIVSQAKYEINNLYLRFDRLAKMSGRESEPLKLAVTFAGSQNSIGDVRVMIDTDTGELSYFRGNFTPVVINSSELLKYENLKNGEFVVSFELTADGGCICRISAGGSVISGEIPQSFFSGLSGAEEAYFAVAPGTGTNYFTVDLTGVKVVDAGAAYEIVRDIESLGDITAESGALIADILTRYSALNGAMKPMVTNMDKLCEAAEEYIGLCSAGLEDGFTLDDGVTVNTLNQIAELTDASWRGEISNLSVISELDAAYRSAIRNGLCAPYENSEYSNQVNDWWSGMFSYTYMPGDAGARLVYTGGGRDVGQGYLSAFNMDGLKIQFNAFRKSDEASNAKMAVYYSGYAGGAWNSSDGKRPFTLVLDMDEGTLTAHPLGEILISDELLKYESIRNQTFSIETNLNSEYLYEVTVSVGTESVSGVISEAALKAGEQLVRPESCYLRFSVWSASYFSYELTGIGPSDTHAQVVRMIDELGVIDDSSADAVNKAKAAYDALPQYAKNRVNNYSLLEEAIELIENGSYYDAAGVIQLIDNIGEVDEFSYDKILRAENAYDSLPDDMKSSVTNLEVLQSALSAYYQLTAPQMGLNSALYAPELTDLSFNSFTNWPFWPDSFSETELEDGGVRFEWFNSAGRNYRDNYGRFALNEVEVTFDNFTAEDENDVVSSQTLAIILSDASNEYNGGRFNYAANRSMALVLDTLSGELTAYGAGAYYIPERVILKDDALKYENISSKAWSVAFTESINGSYKLRLAIEDGTVLTGTIPYSLIKSLDDVADTERLYIGVSAWFDPGRMSVDLISARSLSQASVYEQISPVIKAIDALPEADRITLDDEAELINPILNMYSALGVRGVKEKISNYNKLSEILWRLDELKEAANIDPYTGLKYYFAADEN